MLFLSFNVWDMKEVKLSSFIVDQLQRAPSLSAVIAGLLSAVKPRADVSAVR